MARLAADVVLECRGICESGNEVVPRVKIDEAELMCVLRPRRHGRETQRVSWYDVYSSVKAEARQESDGRTCG
jgi:hypothetical protein